MELNYEVEVFTHFQGTDLHDFVEVQLGEHVGREFLKVFGIYNAITAHFGGAPCLVKVRD